MKSFSIITRAVWPVLLALSCGARAQAPDEWPEFFRVECVGSVTGCDCYTNATGPAVLARVFHAEAARGLDGPPKTSARRRVEIAGRACYYPTDGLRPMPYGRVLRSEFQKLDHTPLDIRILSGETPAQLGRRARRTLGLFWPTYYHLALEDLYPGKAVPVLDPRGHVIPQVPLASAEFLRQVMWEGSGIAKNGTRLHYSGRRLRFTVYPTEIWGYGAGQGYRVHPYRTLAVNFPGFCRRLMDSGRVSSCIGAKSKSLGTLVWIKAVAARAIRTDAAGAPHDGYFCVTDTGSPNYIKSDRIDIFVGTHGGGNPYLPEARRENALIAGGIRNLVPSDWRLWRSRDERVWCDPAHVPAPGAPLTAKACTHDYRTTARDKALELEVLLADDGSPVRCRPGV